MRLVFMGTPESAVPSLRRLLDDGHEIVAVWTQPDKPAGRGNKLHQSPVKEFASQHNLPVHQPSRIKAEEANELFASHNADAAVVVAYGRILPPEFLKAPKHGCINLHFSLLPKYRGAAPVNWAIINGEKETGVTTMQIVKELDAGPILLQRATTIAEGEPAPELMTRLAETGADLLGETISRLGTIEPKPQQSQEATFAPMLKREDGLIDWSMDAFAIERRVRGLQPWPHAYTSWNGRRMIVWRATPKAAAQSPARAGQILEAGGDELVVAAGAATRLHILALQPEGSRPMNTRDFLNGTKIRSGDHFGEQEIEGEL